jgi:leucyl-tRNA synthetase
MVHGKTFRHKGNGRPVPNDQVDDLGNKAVLRATREELDISYEKMSKSKYNGVDPIVSHFLLWYFIHIITFLFRA